MEKYIIELVRKSVINDEDCIDRWTEELEGIKWLENEIRLIEDAFNITPSTDFNNFKNVMEYEEYLKTRTRKYMEQIIIGLKMGGSSNKYLYKLSHISKL